MSQENNSESGNISWFPYVLVVTAILVIGVVILSMNEPKKQEAKQEAAQPANDNAVAQPKHHKSRERLPIEGATVKSLNDANSKPETVSLPYTKENAKNGEHFLFTFNLGYKAGSPSVYNIVPDDCLEKFDINGKMVTLSGEQQQGHCNWTDGFEIDLKPYLHNGDNKVTIEISNGSGPSGLKLFMPKNPE